MMWKSSTCKNIIDILEIRKENTRSHVHVIRKNKWNAATDASSVTRLRSTSSRKRVEMSCKYYADSTMGTSRTLCVPWCLVGLWETFTSLGRGRTDWPLHQGERGQLRRRSTNKTCTFDSSIWDLDKTWTVSIPLCAVAESRAEFPPALQF